MGRPSNKQIRVRATGVQSAVEGTADTASALQQPCILPAVIQRTARVLKSLGRVSTFVGLVASAFVACVGQVRSYPLYPNPQVRREPAKVARLTGIVGTVDGASVAAFGNTFDVEPGCHVVTLVRTVGQGGEHEPWTADVPRLVFAFKMPAGHAYVIEHRVQVASNRTGTVTVTAVERDGSGAIVGPVSPVSGAQDIEDCKQWQAAQSPAP
jgi:hypothetical protein